MKIHFYILDSFPYGMAAAKRRLCYAKGLMAEGHEIDVVVCRKCFDGEDDGLPCIGVFKGIHYNYVCGKKRSSNRILRKTDWFFGDFVKGAHYAIKNIRKNDIVYFYFYANLFELVLLIICKFKGAKTVREVCEHPLALGNKTKWHRICCWFEFNLLFPLFDGFISISRELEKLVNKYKSSTAKNIVVPILVEDDTVKVDEQVSKNPYDVPYIIHTGTMLEQKDSISKILRAFSRFKKETNSDCRLVFTGPQANEKCSYIPLMEKLGIRHSVDLLGLVSVERVAVLQHYATFTIIYKSDNLQTRNCFPTKLGEMLLSGIPVITTNIGDVNIYLRDGESAFIIKEDDEDTLLYRMKELLMNADLRNHIGNAGCSVARKYFSPISQGKKLSVFFCNL